MFIRLIIQNRFHLVLKNFSIWNSLSDVLSAPLFVAAVYIHLCCLRRWISSRRSRYREFFGVKSSSATLCLLFCLHEKGLRFNDSKHCFADDKKTALHECFGHWWEFKIAFSRMLPRNKNALWRQTTVWRHGGHHTSKEESHAASYPGQFANFPDKLDRWRHIRNRRGRLRTRLRAASLQLARTHARFTHCARASRATRL